MTSTPKKMPEFPEKDGTIVAESNRAGYSVKEVASMFAISEWNIRTAVREGQIAALRFGKRVIIPKTEIDRLLG